MKVYTSYFARHKKMPLGDDVAYVSIAVGNPKYELPYALKHCYALKPFGIFGKDITDSEYIRRYRYKLDRLGVDRIRAAITEAAGGKETVLLMCHEKFPQDCHRRDFANWWKEKTGEEIEEWQEKPREESRKEEKKADQLSLEFTYMNG